MNKSELIEALAEVEGLILKMAEKVICEDSDLA